MSVERDAGVAAFEQGDMATAITQLEAATRQDPKDFQAHLYLGAAYGQAERHMDAVNTLTQAVTIEPANAKARYNLGIAMEKAGYKEQAIAVLQQALLLQPDYTKAQEALQRLTGTAAPAQPSAPQTGYVQPPTAGQTTTAMNPQPYAAQQPSSPLPTDRPWPTQPTQNPTPSPYPQQATYPGQQTYGQQPYPGQQQYPQQQPYPQQSQTPYPGQQPAPPAGGLGSYQTPQPGQQSYPQQGAASYGGPPQGAYRPLPGAAGPQYGYQLSEPKEANESLIYGIISLFCCGIILGIVAIVKANTARQIIAANPGMQGGGKATAGLVLGIIGMIGSILLLIIRMMALTAGH